MKKIITLLILVSVLLAGCGKNTPNAAPSGNPSTGDSSNSASTGSSAVSVDTKNSFAAPAGLQSYTISLVSTFKGTISGETVEHINRFTQNVTDPAAARLTRMSVERGQGEPLQMLSARVGPAYYFQRGAAEPCSMSWQPDGDMQAVPELPSLLPNVKSAHKTGTETLDGQTVTHYTFTEKNMPGVMDATAQGEYWLAEGGWVVKLNLTLKGGSAYFGEGAEGEQSTQYEVSSINSLTDLGLPELCKPPMTDLPVMSDAVNLVRHTASINYVSASTPAQVVSFYTTMMADQGWEASEKTIDSEPGQLILFIKELQVAQIYVAEAGTGALVIAGVSLQDPPSDPSDPSTQTKEMRASSAFDILTGSTEKPSPFASYHIDVKLTQPTWDDAAGQVKTEAYTLSADTQGVDAHLTYNTTPEDPSTAVEGYVIGEQGYKVVNGQVEEDLLGVTMEWAMWPLNVIFPISIATTGVELAGTETVEGRTAEVYQVDSAKAPAGVMDAMKSFMMVPVTGSRGTMWVDQETGALLKASLTFEADVVDNQTKAVLGSGPGTLEVTVSQIGQAPVKLP